MEKCLTDSPGISRKHQDHLSGCFQPLQIISWGKPSGGGASVTTQIWVAHEPFSPPRVALCTRVRKSQSGPLFSRQLPPQPHLPSSTSALSMRSSITASAELGATWPYMNTELDFKTQFPGEVGIPASPTVLPSESNPEIECPGAQVWGKNRTRRVL